MRTTINIEDDLMAAAKEMMIANPAPEHRGMR